MKISRYLFVFISISFFLNGCVDRKALKEAKQTTQILLNPVEPVEVQRIKPETISEILGVTGNLIAPLDATIGAKVSARVVAVYVKDGDSVKAGQVLAAQDTTDFAYSVRQSEAQLNASEASLNQAILNAKENPKRSDAGVKSAQAQLRQARTQLKEVLEGTRQEQQRQAEAALTAAKSSFDLATKNLERSQYLFKAGAISKQQLDAETNAHDLARSQYRQAQEALAINKGPRPEDVVIAQQQVAMAEQNLRSAIASQKLDPIYTEQVKQAKASREIAHQSLNLSKQTIIDSRIVAPFSGRIFGQPVQRGTFLGPGSPVARVVGLEGIYFSANVPENRVQRITPGTEVNVRVEGVANKTFKGKVVAIDSSGDMIGRSYSVRVYLDNPVPAIRAGMFGTGKIHLKKVHNAIVIPKASVLRRNDVDGVFVIEQNKAKFIPVRVILTHGTVVQVEGLSVGQQVVVTGQNSLDNKTPVKVTKVKTKVDGVEGEWS